MKKVVIIGCPGAGKTTFSKQLAKKLILPLYHLDYFYHDDRFNYRQDTVAWRQQVSELVRKKEWIIDGNYKSTFDLRFPHADTIIYLDYPRRIALLRAVKRRITLHGKVRDDMPSNWKEQFSFQLFRFIWKYNKVERPKVYASLKTQTATSSIVILRSPKQAEHYICYSMAMQTTIPNFR